jgi:protease-4
MAHNLYRLSQRVFNVPHLIEPRSFQIIADYFRHRNQPSFSIFDPDNDGDDDSDNDNDLDDFIFNKSPVQVLNVDGSLTYKPVEAMCGEVGTSYQELVEQVQTMADNGAKYIVMNVSSGGGEASHMFETADAIRTICDNNDIKLIGYADEMACSAAYGLICVCDVVIANPSAELGSIGVLIALWDSSKALEMEGYKRIFVTSGEDKVPFAADGSFKQSFLDDLQTEVDELMTQFAAHVSKYTGLSIDAIYGFQAKVFNAKNAVENGLANAIMTTQEFSTWLAQITKENN